MVIGIIVAIVVLGIIGLIIAIPIAGLLVAGQEGAKKEARKILEAGVIEDPRKLETTMKLLAGAKDVEADELWKQLDQLRRSV